MILQMWAWCFLYHFLLNLVQGSVIQKLGFYCRKTLIPRMLHTRHSSTFTSGNLRLVSAISGVTGLAGSSRITCLLTRGILAQCSFLKQKHRHTHTRACKINTRIQSSKIKRYRIYKITFWLINNIHEKTFDTSKAKFDENEDSLHQIKINNEAQTAKQRLISMITIQRDLAIAHTGFINKSTNCHAHTHTSRGKNRVSCRKTWDIATHPSVVGTWGSARGDPVVAYER